MIWYVSVLGSDGRVAPAKPHSTKREALTFIASLGELSNISRSVVVGGRSYVVSPKKKS